MKPKYRNMVEFLTSMQDEVQHDMQNAIQNGRHFKKMSLYINTILNRLLGISKHDHQLYNTHSNLAELLLTIRSDCKKQNPGIELLSNRAFNLYRGN